MALLKTARSLAHRVFEREQRKKSRTEEEEDENATYCTSLANLRQLPVHVKGYVRLQIDQLMYQVQFCDHPIAGIPSGRFKHL